MSLSVWPWQGGHFERVAVNNHMLLTSVYIVQYPPNFTCLINKFTCQCLVMVIVPPARHRKLNVWGYFLVGCATPKTRLFNYIVYEATFSES